VLLSELRDATRGLVAADDSLRISVQLLITREPNWATCAHPLLRASSVSAPACILNAPLTLITLSVCVTYRRYDAKRATGYVGLQSLGATT
jgi:hypothetical protein